MYSYDDLLAFSSILTKTDSPDKDVYKILLKLNSWNPIKSQIISSGIGKSLLPLTRKQDENGIMASLVVDKWRKLFINNSSYHEYDMHKLNLENEERDINAISQPSVKYLVYSSKDFDSFCSILKNPDSPDKYVYSVLSKLNAWNPVKTQIIYSGIARYILPLTKISDKKGIMANAIINNWKRKFSNDLNFLNLISKESIVKKLKKSPSKNIILSNHDLKGFCAIFNTDPVKYKYGDKALSLLNDWTPVKDQIIATGIGKCLSKLANLTDEWGTISSSIINKWKRLLDNDVNISCHSKQRMKDNSGSESLAFKNSIWKRKNETVIRDESPKRKCLSLQDYYKRKPSIIPDKKFDPATNGLNSESGISFLDSLTVKTVSKTKHHGPLTLSQLNAGTSGESISQRQDIIAKRDVVTSQIFIESEDMFKPTPCNPRMYIAKSRNVPKVTTFSDRVFDIGLTEPPSLLKQCQVVLLQYKEHIEEVLWTPRELLLDVLHAYTAEQLFHFESFNPRFIEEDEDLWRLHCSRKNIGEARLCDSWRDSYLKLRERYEVKMERSLKTIKTRVEDIKKEEQLKKIKVLTNVRRNPTVRRFYGGQARTESTSNPARRLLQKRYKQMFKH